LGTKLEGESNPTSKHQQVVERRTNLARATLARAARGPVLQVAEAALQELEPTKVRRT